MKIGFRPGFYRRVVPRDRWRRGALSFAAAALFTFIVNLSFTIWGMTIEAPDGVGLIWEGEQTRVKAWNTAMHVVINIISTVLLAGSNYCMQCLMAPTRSELDQAHSKRKWLDIGIPTIRNFWSITLRRKILWILLSISSFPLHLLFNSIIFASISTNRYWVSPVDLRSLTTGDTSSLPQTIDTRGRTDLPDYFPNMTLSLMDVSTCLNDYGTAFQSRRGSVLLVIDFTGLNKSSVEILLDYKSSGGQSGSFHWVCQKELESSITGEKPCDEQIAGIKSEPNSWKPFGLELKACYSKETQEHSKLFFSRAICWIVTSLNLFKAVVMLIVAYDGIGSDEPPILTAGDAVASYLQDPDKYTIDMCLKSKSCFAEKNWEPIPLSFNPIRHRKYSAGSVGRWIVCISLCLLALCVCGYLLHFGISDLQSYSSTPTVPLEKYGPGVVHSNTIMDVFSPDVNVLLLSVLLVNTPQVLMSLIYFNYNALFTCMSLATEWDRFYSGTNKGLRVSTDTQGAQRQTYFLQLPYRYSLTLAVFSGGLHWLISQSIFLVRIEVYDDDDNFMRENTSSGWSPIGIILVIVAGAVLIGFLVVSGYFRLRYGGIPVAGSCSAAIAAACHPDSSEPDSLATLPLTWGVVTGKDVTPGHCSFTSKEADKPVEGCLYE